MAAGPARLSAAGWRSTAWLALLLLVSAGLRIGLAARGGQYFFGDEARYDRGVELYLALLRGDGAAVGAVLARPEHALFTAVGAAVTAAQHGLAQFTPYGDWSHPENVGFTMWLAGDAVKGGIQYGATDDYGYYAVKEKMHIHDLHATLLHLLGLDHEKLTYRYAGRDFRLTDVEGHVAREIIA